jgi:hypothetical protein
MENENKLMENRAKEIAEAEANKTPFSIINNVDFTVDKNKSFTEQAKDFVGAVATKKAIEDEHTVQKITKLKQDELIAHAEADSKKEETSGKAEEENLQKANYGIYKGVATYAGIEKPLPNLMQKILFSFLAVFQTIFLLFLGTATSIINITADCINSIVIKISQLTKSAKVIFFGLIAIGGVVLLFILVRYMLFKYNIL